MCGGGNRGGGSDRAAEKRAEDRQRDAEERQRQFAIDQAAKQAQITQEANDRFDAMMEKNATDMAEATKVSQEALAKQAEDARIERERIANLKPVAGRQSMQSNLSIPQAPGDFAPPPNPGTGTSTTFDPLSVAPTFVNDNVKPVVRGGAGLTRGGASSVNDKTTIDKTLRIGSAKNKKKPTGLNVPT
jgi:hypothetical protein